MQRGQTTTTRPASHAGSWYLKDKNQLSTQLDFFLSKVKSQTKGIRPWSQSLPEGPLPREGARVIIAPHAGYTYSGPAAAWAYRALDIKNAKRIFLLGPSHHPSRSHCRLTKCTKYETPLGDLVIDTDMIATLMKGNEDLITWMEYNDDVREHSLEMHLPYIYKTLTRNFESPDHFPKLTPILIGRSSKDTDRRLGKLLAPYIADPENVFIVSSDFCHWGYDFDYRMMWLYGSHIDAGEHETTPDAEFTESWDAETLADGIAGLDHRSMDAIETGKYDSFVQDLKETGNTVCGAHPIRVMMAALEVYRKNAEAKAREDESLGRFQFIRYERSGKNMDVTKSSVSYCSAFAIV